MSGKSLVECEAFSRLLKLAKDPIDLTGKEIMTSKRVLDYCCQGKYFDLLYGCQRVNEEVLDGLQSVADECRLVEQFQAMRTGATCNRIDNFPSENRQVLHTSCRDLFSKKPLYPLATEQARVELAKLKDFLEALASNEICNAQNEPFHTLIHVGIGGSDLGPRSICEALQAYANQDRAVHFIANVDPDDFAKVMQQVDLTRSLVVVVSKSGTTLETLANETMVRDALTHHGLQPEMHCISVTGKGSPMDDPDRYLRSFYMYDYIGGRYSATSMVGALTIGFAIGYDKLLRFLEGANSVDNEACENDIRKNVPLLLAMLGIWNHNFLGIGSVAVLPYSQALHRFPAHLQQCDMESNGKSIERDGQKVRVKSGPVVWGEPGTNGQHAFYQLLHQGTEEVAMEFIGFRNNQRGCDYILEGSSSQEKLLANLLAQSMALAIGKEDANPNRAFAGNRVNSVLIAEQLTPESMGALLALYEAKIVFQGFCWNINSFDQEGVQLGKILATELLSIMGGNASGSNLAMAFLQAASLKS